VKNYYFVNFTPTLNIQFYPDPKYSWAALSEADTASVTEYLVEMAQGSADGEMDIAWKIREINHIF